MRGKHRHQQEPVTESSVSAASIRHRGSQGKSKESKKVSSKSAAGEVGADGKQSLTHPTDHPTDTDVREVRTGFYQLFSFLVSFKVTIKNFDIKGVA